MTPRLSIVVVTWNSAADIERCLSRLESCTTVPFEVLIVDNASQDATLRAVSAFAAGKSPETWRLILNDENSGYAKAANQGFRAAKGDLIAFLNPDTAVSRGWDEALAGSLKPGAGAVGPISNHAAGLQFFERWLDESGPAATLADLMENAGCCSAAPVRTKLLMGFCLMVRRETLEEHGAFDETLVLGGDDLEFSLRLRRAGLDLFVVPGCFVWHRGQASFGHHPAEAVENFRQEGVDGVYRRLVEWYGVDGVPPPMELWGINWFHPTALKADRRDLVSIVIPVHNGLADTLACLESIGRFTPEAHEIIVVDNGSTDGTAAALRERGGVTLLRHETNRGFAGGVNSGIRAANGTSILILNNDTLVTAGWLATLEEGLLAGPRAGLVGAVSNYVGCNQQIPVTYADPAAAFAFGAAWNRAHRTEFETVDGLTGLCLLVKRSVFDVVGLFDERFTIGNYEDNDFCLRARLANFDLVLARGAFVHHAGNRTFQALGVDYRDISDRNRRLFLEKWGMSTGGPGEGNGESRESGDPPPPPEPGALPDRESELWTAIETLGPPVLDDAVPLAERRAAAETLYRLATAAGRADIAAEFAQALGRFDSDAWPDHLPEAGMTLVLGATTASLVAAHERGLRITAVDDDPAVLAAHLEQHPALPVLHGAFAALPAPDGAFDRVVFATPLEAFENPGAVLREARRVAGTVLRADGTPQPLDAAVNADRGERFAASLPGPVDPRRVALMADEAAVRGGRALVVAADPAPYIQALEARGLPARGGADLSGWARDLFDLALIPDLEAWPEPQAMLAPILAITKPGATILVSAPDDAAPPAGGRTIAGRRWFSGASLHAELSLYGREVRRLRIQAAPGTPGAPARFDEALPGRLIASFVNEKGMDPARDFPIERSLLSADDRARLADLPAGRGAVVFAAAPFDPPRGGAEISARRIADEIAREREVHVVSLGTLNRSRRLGSLIVHETFDPGRFHDLIVMLKPDIVLTQLVLAPVAIEAARAAGARSVLFVRSYEPLCPAPLALMECDRRCFSCIHFAAAREAMEQQRRAVREADRVVVNSVFMRDVVKELTGVDATVAYPPVDTAQDETPPPAAPGPSKSRTPAQPATKIALVKPAPHKGLFVLLELARRMPEQEFLLVGGRPPVPLPANVAVRDWVEPDRVLDGVRLLLVPSQWPEPFGRVVVEALGRGVPVLAGRVGGLPEAGGEVARYVDDFGNPEAWEKAVRAMLEDPGLDREIRITGPAWAVRFAAAKTVRPLVADLLDAAADRAGLSSGGSSAAAAFAGPAGTNHRIQWQGPFFEHHSFAQVNRELVAALLELGVPVVPLDSGSRRFEPHDSTGRRLTAAMVPGDAPAPELTVRCGWPPRFHRPASGKLVLIVPWEFGAVPASWIRAADRNADEVWAISDFVRASWLRGGFDPERIVTVPLGVRADLFHPGAPAASLPTAKSFRFLWVGGATPRKGIDILLTAYERAFTADDDVCLVLKDVSLYGGQVAGAVAKFRERSGAPEILHMVDDVPPEAMPSLYRACQAYVAPYRGEGYGLPIAEAMSSGIPVIVTGHGGAMQFAHPGIAGILPATLLARGGDGIDGYGTMGIPFLAEPSAADTAEAMRVLHRDQDAARKLGAKGSEAIRAGHTWVHAARAARARIAALVGVSEFALERSG